MKFIKGNAVDYVMETDGTTLLHVCNNKGVMGSGIAREIKDRIPSAYENYVLCGERNKFQLGTVSYSSCFRVCNMVCQDGYGKGGKFIRYGRLAQCLMSLPEGLQYVIPYKMGSDRAGGDWDVVQEICCDILGETNITVVSLW